MTAKLSLQLSVCLFLAPLSGLAQSGAELFQANCSVCHKAGNNTQAPLPDVLGQMPWQAVLTALETGKMKAQGATLTAEQRTLVAKFVGGEGADAIPQSAHCTASTPLATSAPSWNAWGIDPINSRFQTAKAAGLTRDTVPKLQLKWAFGFPGVTTAFGTPTVFGGRVFVGSQDGTVYSLNAQTGCIYWTFKATEGVRAAIVVSSNGRRAYFGDLHANMFAVNAATGELLWKTHVDEHPFAVITGTPKLEGGRLYVPVSGGDEPVAAGNPAFTCCSFRGSLVALNADTGKQIWKGYTIPEPAKVTGKTSAGTDKMGPSGASLWSTPTLDLRRKAIYIGTGINFSDPATKTSDAIVAFDMESGKLLWSQQFTAGDRFNFGCVSDQKANCPENPGKDSDIGSSPLLRPIGGGRRILVVADKAGMIHGVDPDQEGKIVWETRGGAGGPQGGFLWGGASDEKIAYFSISDWNPGNPEAGGGIIALDLTTGRKLWGTPAPKPACIGTQGCSAAQPGAVSLIPGVLFAGSLDGHLRAYDTSNGKIILDVDTFREFPTVNGVKAKGGSMNGTGPTIAGGMVFANSGYSRLPLLPGNVLLAFSVDGK